MVEVGARGEDVDHVLLAREAVGDGGSERDPGLDVVSERVGYERDPAEVLLLVLAHDGSAAASRPGRVVDVARPVARPVVAVAHELARVADLAHEREAARLVLSTHGEVERGERLEARVDEEPRLRLELARGHVDAERKDRVSARPVEVVGPARAGLEPARELDALSRSEPLDDGARLDPERRIARPLREGEVVSGELAHVGDASVDGDAGEGGAASGDRSLDLDPWLEGAPRDPVHEEERDEEEREPVEGIVDPDPRGDGARDDEDEVEEHARGRAPVGEEPAEMREEPAVQTGTFDLSITSFTTASLVTPEYFAFVSRRSL